jgi:hypothetical protein
MLRSSGESEHYKQNHYIRTCDFICYAMSRLKHVEHVSIDRESFGAYLGPIFSWLNFPKLKRLDIRKGNLEGDGGLEVEVPVALFVMLIKKAPAYTGRSKLTHLVCRSIGPHHLRSSIYLGLGLGGASCLTSFGGLPY